MKKLSPPDWLLLVLSAAGDVGLTPLKLQKSLFLLEKNNISKSSIYDFIPYNYGPFDLQIYNDAEELVGKGYVEKLDGNNSHTWKKYRITLEGNTHAQSLWKLLPTHIAEFVTGVIKWILPLSFQDLVATIYNKYPEYKVNSVFRKL